MQHEKAQIAVYGGANLDIQAKSKASFLKGDSNPGSLRISPGGVGRNIAENLSRLEVRTELVSVFGMDSLSGILKDSCKAAGIRFDRSVFLPDKSSSAYVCLLDSDGSLAGAVAAMDLFDELTLEMMEDCWSAGDEADLIVLDGNFPEIVLAAAVSRWPDKPLLFDPVSETKAARGKLHAGCFKMLKPNLHEAELMAGISLVEPIAGHRARAVAAARALVGLGVSEVFVSIGSLGLVYADSTRCGHVFPLDLPVVNVSGAGDAATAALATASLRGYDVDMKACMAVALASFCAASAMTVDTGTDMTSLIEAAGRVRNERL